MSTEVETKVEKNQGTPMSKTERFVYETLLSERTDFFRYCREHNVPSYIKDTSEDSNWDHYKIWIDPLNIEQVKIVTGSEYSFADGTVIVSVWNELDEPFTDLIARATTVWMERTKRQLSLIEITAKHRRELLDLDVLEISDIVSGGLNKPPFFRFMGQEIGKE